MRCLTILSRHFFATGSSESDQNYCSAPILKTSHETKLQRVERLQVFGFVLLVLQI